MAAFLMLTESVDSLGFTPVAKKIYSAIARICRPGKEFNINLQEIQSLICKSRSSNKKDYSRRHIRRGLEELIAVGVIDVVGQWFGGLFRLVAYHPDRNPTCSILAKNGTEKANSFPKMSNLGGSNTHDSVASSIDLAQTTDTPPTNHPVVESKNSPEKTTSANQNVRSKIFPILERLTGISESNQKLPDEEKNSPGDVVSSSYEVRHNEKVLQARPEQSALLDEVEAEGVKLHPKLVAFLLAADIRVLKNAVAAMKEAKRAQKVRNPSGFLVKAVEEKWEPAGSGEAPHSQMLRFPPEFLDWYAKVPKTSSGVLNIPLEHLPVNRHNEPQVRIGRRDPFTRAPYTLMPWREAAAEFPVE